MNKCLMMKLFNKRHKDDQMCKHCKVVAVHKALGNIPEPQSIGAFADAVEWGKENWSYGISPQQVATRK